MMRTRLLTEEEKRDLRIDLVRANRLRDFMETEFYRHDFDPWLRDENIKSAEKNRFKPNAALDSSPEKVGSQILFNSGMMEQVDRVFKQFNMWLMQGKEAAEKLGEDARLADAKKAGVEA